MNEQSILFLGSSEILGNDLGVFELAEQEGQYFFIKGDVYRPENSQAFSWSQPTRTQIEPVTRSHELVRTERLVSTQSIELPRLNRLPADRQNPNKTQAFSVLLQETKDFFFV